MEHGYASLITVDGYIINLRRRKMADTSKELPLIIVRRSVALFVIRVILLELIFEAIYLSWRTIIHYLPIPLETVVTLNGASIIVFLVLVTLIQNILLIIVALKWVNDYYEVGHDEVAHVKGIVSRTKQSYPFHDIQSITVHQGFLGRLLKYGEVNLYIPTLGHDLHFREVSNPERFVELVKNINPKVERRKYIFKR